MVDDPLLAVLPLDPPRPASPRPRLGLPLEPPPPKRLPRPASGLLPAAPDEAPVLPALPPPSSPVFCDASSPVVSSPGGVYPPVQVVHPASSPDACEPLPLLPVEPPPPDDPEVSPPVLSPVPATAQPAAPSAIRQTMRAKKRCVWAKRVIEPEPVPYACQTHSLGRANGLSFAASIQSHEPGLARPAHLGMPDLPDPRRFPSSYALHVVELASRWGVPDRVVLGELAIDREQLADPAGTLTLAEAIGLVERTRIATREPALGFYLGLQMSASAHGYLGFAAMSAPTLRDALELAVQYAPIRTSFLSLRLDVAAESAALVVEELEELGAARDVVLIGLLVGVWQIGNALLGREVKESTVDLTLPEPAYYARFRHVSPRVRFQQPANRLVFDPALLGARLVSADPASLRLAQEQCARELDMCSARSPLVERVRRLVLRADAGVRSFEELAEALHVSPRTLRRRLAEAKVSFSELLDQVRRDRALLLLRSVELSTKEIAERVGYSDVANFMRAFRRWTGRTPAAYRREGTARS